MRVLFTFFSFQLLLSSPAHSRIWPPACDLRHYETISTVSTERLEKDVNALADFGTRHTLPDTLSNTGVKLSYK